jgi:hypothetical protein
VFVEFVKFGCQDDDHHGGDVDVKEGVFVDDDVLQEGEGFVDSMSKRETHQFHS